VLERYTSKKCELTAGPVHVSEAFARMTALSEARSPVYIV